MLIENNPWWNPVFFANNLSPTDESPVNADSGLISGQRSRG
jgi:hypothetical protein